MTPAPHPPEHLASHAGGVVYRLDPDGARYLLVSAKSAPKERVFPKGHIDPGETADVAAIREIREESGVLANIVADLGFLRLIVRRQELIVHMFLLKAFGKAKHDEPWRVVEWVTFDTAMKHATHDETKQMLTTARDILRQQDSSFR